MEQEKKFTTVQVHATDYDRIAILREKKNRQARLGRYSNRDIISMAVDALEEKEKQNELLSVESR